MTDADTAPPAAVVFDLDGVLLDTTENMRIAFETTWRAAGRTGPAPFEEFLTHMGAPLGQILAAMAVPDGHDVYVRASGERPDLLRVYPGIEDLLQALAVADIPTAVATGKSHTRADEALRASGLAPYLDAVVGSDEVRRPKPDPEIVHTALDRLGCAASAATVFVGDSVLDMHAGRAAGVRVVAAGWGQAAAETLLALRPDHYAAEPRQLFPLLSVRPLAAHHG